MRNIRRSCPNYINVIQNKLDGANYTIIKEYNPVKQVEVIFEEKIYA